MTETAPGYCLPIEFASPDFDLALDLRTRVLREPLGLSFSEKDIREEYKEFHLGYYSPQIDLQAVLSLKPISAGVVKMRQVAVEPHLQKSGIGRKLVEASEHWAAQLGFSRIELHARDIAVPFYLKLGYSIVGEPFTEVGIPHAAMFKSL